MPRRGGEKKGKHCYALEKDCDNLTLGLTGFKKTFHRRFALFLYTILQPHSSTLIQSQI